MSRAATLTLHTIVPGPATESSAWPTQTPEWAEFERDTPRTLPEGMRLHDYEIVGPIGEGGFGIVYLAWDHAQQRHVAIKEYLPAVLAWRASASPAVIIKSPRHQDSFRIGLRSFINEARILARFDHPSLVRVLHYWEGNGTAYMAMPYYQGPTLARALAELGRPPEEAELCRWLRPLLDALGTLHAVSCFHRDIAPDNVLLTDGGPVLLDFGAARRVIDGAGQSPTVVFKPGFTPIEQYGELASMRQGPWTDLYALAAMVYAAIAGQPPVSSVQRMPDDPLRPLSETAQGRYSAHFLAAVDAALSVYPKDRPQSAAEFWNRLSGQGLAREMPDEAPAPARVVPPPAAEAADARAMHAVVRGFVPSLGEPPAPRAEPFTAMTPRPRPRPAPARRSRARMPALAAVVLLLGLVTAGYYRIGDPTRTAPPMAVLATLPPPPAAPVVAPVAKPALREPTPAPRPAEAAPPPPIAAAVLPAPPDAPEAAAMAEAPFPPRRAARSEAARAPAAAAPAPKLAMRAPAEPTRAAHRQARAPVAEAAAPRPAVAVAAVRMAQAESASAHARCSDILQRASLEPLGAGEAALLRKGCE